MVFQVLSDSPEGRGPDFRNSDLYKACIEAGFIPGGREDAFRKLIDPAGVSSRPRAALAVEGLTEEVVLKVEGMWCPACAWVIEKALQHLEGVVEARVRFLSDTARVKYLPYSLSLEALQDLISKLGYRAAPFVDPSEKVRDTGDLVVRLGISSILTMNVMMLSFFLYTGFFRTFGEEVIDFFSYPLWALATPVLFYGGLPILKRGYISLRHACPTMDTLISLGAIAAYVFSVIQVARGSLHLYFDTASMLITLVLLGRYIESKAREKVSRGIQELYHLASYKVRVIERGEGRWIAPDQVGPGQEFVVLPGERAPIDGWVLSGTSKVDESVLTGESKPVSKRPGDEVLGGSLLLNQELHLKVKRTGRASALNQMIGLVEEALSRKNPFELLSDRIMRWFVPGVFAVAAVTVACLLLRGSGPEVALFRALTVIVITCPCALGIASPLAKIAAVGTARSRGVLIRDPGALEKAKDLDCIVFDKTGTLTEGNFLLRDVACEAMSKEDALLRIASLESEANHFLAREIVRAAKDLGLTFGSADRFEERSGRGIIGCVKGVDIVVGNRELMRMENMNLPKTLEQDARSLECDGMTVVFFAWESRVQGFLVLGDSIRESATRTVRDLQKRGIEVCLLSGDAEETTRAVALRLGIGRFYGKMLPKDKAETIQRIQEEGHRVGMVGDGVNDAIALAQADVGFALGTGVSGIAAASDITLVSSDPARIKEVLTLSKLTVRTIRQNLLFGFLYNGCAIPLAISGVLTPLIAVVAMIASSLSVVGNTLRISRDRCAVAKDRNTSRLPNAFLKERLHSP
jgi:heavy metal translocating P-type ATPase